MSNLLKNKESAREPISIMKKTSDRKKESVYITEPKPMFDSYKVSSGQLTTRVTKLPSLSRTGTLVPPSMSKKSS